MDYLQIIPQIKTGSSRCLPAGNQELELERYSMHDFTSPSP